ncbi:hypothetical protein EVJ58_g4602 [Rhodofomes roseus]|uniref:PH domain-containing protein n=1 Tax=Rhodofomes roseus TaxID=34475 RepID=A0A4Y9YFF2_9APHY|nr:hypothetical protein EVJ58_g4602 [Rhodofomes roseus]
MASVARPPHSLLDVVHDAIQHKLEDHETDHDRPEHPLTPPLGKTNQAERLVNPDAVQGNANEQPPPDEHGEAAPTAVAQEVSRRTDSPEQDDEPPSPLISREQARHRPRLSSGSGVRLPPPDTPSGRTGPPRSISRSYSLSQSGRFDSKMHRKRASEPTNQDEGDGPDRTSEFRTTTPFRDAMDYQDPHQRERERHRAEKMARRRDSAAGHDIWSAMKKRLDTPREEHSQIRWMIEGGEEENEKEKGAEAKGKERAQGGAEPEAKEKHEKSVNITDELIAGGLSALVLRLWFERDERDHRRVPILFHRLRIRVSDSLHPLHGNKAVFRIECEYANGAVRWVVYRQLREFLSLHAHYTVSNAYFRNVETLPDFPMMSLPYFKFLKERGRDVGRADFARMQREALENYLIGLVRAVMWHPSANRLAGFLEISALMVALAQSGGAQYKAGTLRIDTIGNKGNLGRRATSWRERKTPKWCSVRESYLVVHEEVGELTVWDVFLIDTDFKIERPTRYYRQGLNLLQHFEDDHPEVVPQSGHESAMVEHHEDHPHTWHKMSSIKSHIGNLLHIHQHQDSEKSRSASHVNEKHADGDPRHSNGRAGTDPGHHRPSLSATSFSSSSSSSRPVTPMLDPSTNTNPLLGPEDHDEFKHDEQETNSKKRKSRSRANEVSKHTFYIENSQMRLKLFAKNERQMLQWIAALERVARDCHYTGKNRFDSFAPIRLNVAAQWLVDGRDYFWNLSRAIMLATECIYIHDWWLSPELQMRRPGLPKYRLDNLLERKAKEGVKIYIIL